MDSLISDSRETFRASPGRHETSTMTKKYRDWSISRRLRATIGDDGVIALSLTLEVHSILPVTSDQLIIREMSFFSARPGKARERALYLRLVDADVKF